MSGGSQQTSTQTASASPWGPSQGHLKGIMGDAQRLYDNNKGFKPFAGERYVPFSQASRAGMQTMEGLASQPNPMSGNAINFTNGLLGGQFNHDTSGYQALMGQNPNAISKYGTGIASGKVNQNALANYGTGIASGQQRINTEGGYRGLMNSVNPEFENVVQETANDVGDQIQRGFGGTAYGSPENADYITKGVGDVVSRMRSDNFYNNMGLQRGLLGDISGVQGQNIGNRLSAAGMLSGEQGSNINNRLNAAGMLSGEQQQGFNNQRGLLGDITNANQLSLQNRMGGIPLMDTAYQSQYAPAERMMQIGGMQEGKSGEQLQANMDRWNQQQMAPWDRLSQYFGIASGTGAQGNRTQTSISEPTDIWSKLMGGGLLGSQMFSGMF